MLRKWPQKWMGATANTVSTRPTKHPSTNCFSHPFTRGKPWAGDAMVVNVIAYRQQPDEDAQ